MDHMLYKFNQPLPAELWKTNQVVIMRGTLRGCAKFNQPLTHFDTRNVENMNSLFEECAEFNQPLDWTTSKVGTMAGMFLKCPQFNQQLKWDTRAVWDMSEMFYGCTALSYVMEFDMSNVSSKKRMFRDCGAGGDVIDVGMAAQRVALEGLKLKEKNEKRDANDPDVCINCWKRKREWLIHPPDPPGSDPHMLCGNCTERLVLISWQAGKKLECPMCQRTFVPSKLQQTAFGRYAKKACGHKRRAAEYHRVGLADAHDARAREYALGAARVLGASVVVHNLHKKPRCSLRYSTKALARSDQ
jgi:hypothetical protein